MIPVGLTMGDTVTAEHYCGAPHVMTGHLSQKAWVGAPNNDHSAQ